METFDLLVIGGGAGGLVSAGMAASLGARVAIVSESPLGGECLYTGCVPSKALLSAAKKKKLFPESPLGFKEAMNSVQTAIKTIEPHDSPEHMIDAYGVAKIYQNRAEFIDPHTLQVGNERIKAKKIILATGAQTFIPPIEGIHQVDFLTHENIFNLTEQPKTLAIIGSGPIGMEMGQAFQRLGTQVTVVQHSKRILSKESNETSELMINHLRNEGIQFILETETLSIEDIKGKKHLTLSNNHPTLIVDALLIATGKRPNTSNMGLDKAGVKFTSKGITIDKHGRTSAKHIWAVGDVTGKFQLTHYAEHQAKVAVMNALIKWPQTLETTIVPWVTYTDPEIAHVGLHYHEAQKMYKDVHRIQIPLTETDRYIIEQQTQGFAEVTVQSNGKILGATLIAEGAGELIHEIVLAMSLNCPLQKLSDVIHAYPTRSDLIKNLSYQFQKEVMLTGWKKELISRWIKLTNP